MLSITVSTNALLSIVVLQLKHKFPIIVSTNALVKTLLSITVSTNALLSIVVSHLKHCFLLQFLLMLYFP